MTIMSFSRTYDTIKANVIVRIHLQIRYKVNVEKIQLELETVCFPSCECSGQSHNDTWKTERKTTRNSLYNQQYQSHMNL